MLFEFRIKNSVISIFLSNFHTYLLSTRIFYSNNKVPAVIGIFYYRCACFVNQLYNIALSVAEVVVISAVIVNGYHLSWQL